MALKFRSNPSEKIYTADEFFGVDFTSEPSKVSAKRSPDAKNMLINKKGYVEKRTGYRRVFETNGSINGIFEYLCPQNSTTYRFIHIGTSLYKFSFDTDGSFVLGDEILTGLKDKKSRAFTFGSSLYILGAGYIKIGYDEFTKNICYGFVNKVCTVCDEETAPLIISGRAPNGEFDGESFEYNGANSYKKIQFANGRYSFNSQSKIYIAQPEYADKIRVASLYYQYENGGYFRVGERYYSVLVDEKGLYIRLEPNANIIREGFDCEPYVVVEYDEFVYAPTVVTGREPIREDVIGGKVIDENGTEISTFVPYTGDVLEAANLASGKRKIDFSCGAILRTKVKALRLYIGQNTTLLGVWVDGNRVHQYYRQGSGEKIRTNTSEGYIEIATEYEPSVQSESIITVEYMINEPCDVIDNCDIYALYGGSNDTRAFVSGNEKYRARDFASGLFDGTYFSDLMYTDVGAEESAIVGYHKLFGNLVIVKDGIGKDSSQYLRSFSLATDDDGNTTALFTVKQGNISYGAINKSSFKNVGGTPIYIGNDGVFVIQGTNVENQHNTISISHMVNGRLLKHNSLSEAVCATLGGKYYVFLDTQAYICDVENGFEWFYFDALPNVRCVWINGDDMYFGAEDGAIYRFMNEDEQNAYYDNVAIDGSIENTRAIEAIWEIGATTLGEYANYKTIRNCYITCMPHKRSSVKVYYNTNEDYRDWVFGENIDLFSFDDVDFERFSFRTIQAPFVFATGVKVKNAYVFGLRLVNDVGGEPFGFLAVSIKYRSGKYVK